MKKNILSLLLICATLFSLSSCKEAVKPEIPGTADGFFYPSTPSTLLGGKDDAFGESVTSTEMYDGYFEEDIKDIKISHVSGTENAYKLDGDTLIFSSFSQNSVYSISGKFRGNIVIDISSEYELKLELSGLSIVSDKQPPVNVISANKVDICAKSGTKNYIYDIRESISSDKELIKSSIYALSDIELSGKGSLTVVSENNNGIHTKDDLEIKNLSLFVYCNDNCLKGNDSVTIESGSTNIIATSGDCIKTSNSNVSEKGVQRGNVSILGGSHTLYAACDGIDASHNVIIDGETTALNIYTDKYSNYSDEVTKIDAEVNYIRFTSKDYSYSVKYYNSDSDFIWVNADHHSTVSGGRSSYHYYSYPKNTSYNKIQFFIYSSDMKQGQDEEYLAATDLLTPSEDYDTFAFQVNFNGQLSCGWTSYSKTAGGGMGRPDGFGGMGGHGGFQDGNSDKADYSCKGIKSSNEIIISAGKITIKSYDDAIHAKSDSTLENGKAALGNLTVFGGELNLYSNDDGIHADNKLTLSGGIISIVNSYEGIEGTTVEIFNGSISVISKDDGINATTSSGTAVTIGGGNLFIYAGGDGIDSNSRSSYTGISFEGGSTVVITTSGGNSAIDSEQGYKYTNGSVLAIMPRGSMTNEATHVSNFSSIATSKNLSLSEGEYLCVKTDGEVCVSLKLPLSLSGVVIYLGSSNASIECVKSSTLEHDGNGVYVK